MASNVAAQEPIAMDGKEWVITYEIPGAEESYISVIREWIEGDTIVDGIACKKLYTVSPWGGGDDNLEVGYCRQDSEKFYKNGKLMFDLGLQVGDTLFLDGYELYGSGYYVVHDVDYVVLQDGISRKRLTVLFDEAGFEADFWVEGIGSLNMGIYSNQFRAPGLHIKAVNCLYNGHLIYETPNSNIEEHVYKPSPVFEPYYDLQGRKVAHPTRGIYIKDGRKVVIKSEELRIKSEE